jgi:hypothetical protein
MTERLSGSAESRAGFYPYRQAGQTKVKCRTCGESGLTSRRLVGRARFVDACGECLWFKAEGLRDFKVGGTD